MKENGHFAEEKNLPMMQKIIKSALLSDLFEKEEDYVILENKVTIIDRNTGYKKEGSKWSKSIHEFIEIKEGIEVNEPSYSYGSINQEQFFNLYQKIIGVTETIGTEEDKKTFLDLYNVKLFQAPRHFFKEKKIIYELRPPFEILLFRRVEIEIIKMREKGRPILVIFDSIKRVKDFVNFSRFKNIIKTIEGVDPKKDNESVKYAGEEGAVTIATSAGGRGMDIILSKDSILKGGLHVVVPEKMPNKRALEQAIGRAGRQGQPGSALILLSKWDRFIKYKKVDKTQNNLFKLQNYFSAFLKDTYHFNKSNDKIYHDIEYPLCAEIDEILEISSFKIFQQDNSFDYVKNALLQAWAYLFIQLSLDEKAENFSYCYHIYLNFINSIRKYYKNNDKELKEYINSRKPKLSGELLFKGALIIGIFATSFICPPASMGLGAKLLICGGVEAVSSILTQLYCGEKIDWKEVFVEGAVGAATMGITSKLKNGKKIQKVLNRKKLLKTSLKILGITLKVIGKYYLIIVLNGKEFDFKMIPQLLGKEVISFLFKKILGLLFYKSKMNLEVSIRKSIYNDCQKKENNIKGIIRFDSETIINAIVKVIMKAKKEDIDNIINTCLNTFSELIHDLKDKFPNELTQGEDLKDPLALLELIKISYISSIIKQFDVHFDPNK